MTRLECSWFKADIGPRLKAVTKRVYEVWSELTGDELYTHLHSIVSITHLPRVPDSKLTRYISATKHGHLPSTLASGNGCSFSQASLISPSTLVSLTAQKQAPRSSTWAAVSDKLFACWQPMASRRTTCMQQISGRSSGISAMICTVTRTR